MPDKKALLMFRSDPPGGEAAWNEWHHTRFIPDRLALPGFLSGRRFRIIYGTPEEQPGYLALFDLADAKAVNSKAYLKLKENERAAPVADAPNFSAELYRQIYPEKGEYEPPSCKFLFLVGHDVPLNREKEFHAWYHTEHIPAMLRVPGFVTVRRFVALKGATASQSGIAQYRSKFLTVYDLESEEALSGPVFDRLKESPWSAWVRTWYTKRFRALYRRIYPET